MARHPTKELTMTFSNPHNLPICMMKQVPLKTLKSGDTFLRKIDAQRTLKRQHYNRATVFFGPANYSCGDAYGDINYEIFLKGSTQVWVEMTEKDISEQWG
tara:strand:- start:256 stop:558 length:303 start_codon:yes stop_codon:yes gene_type:complete